MDSFPGNRCVQTTRPALGEHCAAVVAGRPLGGQFVRYVRKPVPVSLARARFTWTASPRPPALLALSTEKLSSTRAPSSISCSDIRRRRHENLVHVAPPPETAGAWRQSPPLLNRAPNPVAQNHAAWSGRASRKKKPFAICSFPAQCVTSGVLSLDAAGTWSCSRLQSMGTTPSVISEQPYTAALDTVSDAVVSARYYNQSLSYQTPKVAQSDTLGRL
jgi:hypothetical protein